MTRSKKNARKLLRGGPKTAVAGPRRRRKATNNPKTQLSCSRGPFPAARISTVGKSRKMVRTNTETFNEVIHVQELTAGASPMLLFTVDINPVKLGGRLEEFAKTYQRWVPEMIEFNIQSAMPTSYSGAIALAWIESDDDIVLTEPIEIQRFIAESGVSAQALVYANSLRLNVPVRMGRKYYELNSDTHDISTHGRLYGFLTFPFAGPAENETGMFSLWLKTRIRFELPAPTTLSPSQNVGSLPGVTIAAKLPTHSLERVGVSDTSIVKVTPTTVTGTLTTQIYTVHETYRMYNTAMDEYLDLPYAVYHAETDIVWLFDTYDHAEKGLNDCIHSGYPLTDVVAASDLVVDNATALQTSNNLIINESSTAVKALKVFRT